MAKNFLRRTGLIDRPHLLVCEELLTAYDIDRVCQENQASVINLRDELLSRLPIDEHNLLLHLEIDRECDAIRTLAWKHSNTVLLLTEMEVILTNISAHTNRDMQTCLHRLMLLRQLESLVWIVLPLALVPGDWPKDRLYYFRPV